MGGGAGLILKKTAVKKIFIDAAARRNVYYKGRLGFGGANGTFGSVAQSVRAVES